jgi:hypothetical protein
VKMRGDKVTCRLVPGDKVALQDLIWGQLHFPSALVRPMEIIVSFVGSP